MSKLKNKISVRDIALKVGVSPTAVSLALKDSPRVGEELREKIKNVAKQMNYHRNRLVESIIRGKSNTIGIILKRITESFQGNVTDKVIDLALEDGFFSVVYNHHLDPLREKKFIHEGIEKQLEGFIIFSTCSPENDEDFKQLQEMGIPFVLVDKSVPNMHCNSVVCDDQKGAFEITKYLIGLGHKKIAHISGNLGYYSAPERLAGYKDALDKAGVAYSPEMIFNLTYDVEDMDGLMAKELAKFIKEIKPTAIFCGNDYIAGFTARVIAGLNMKIPGDVSIAGYGCVEKYVMGTIRLTSVDQHVDDIGKTAAKMLIDDIREKRKAGQVNRGIVKIIPSKVVKGDSCRKLR